MKVAIASGDGSNVSGHFGRSGCFVLVDIAPTGEQTKTILPNEFTRHGQGACGHKQHGDHSHKQIVDVLAGCDAVLCGGLGRRAAAAFEIAGIHAYRAPAGITVDDALKRYRQGTLEPLPNGTCDGQH
ncbi:MAG: NifB/NifX family molybdenum-iron cluster-binding protein [Deltaproteobacteria bacterium]|nr:NifB/NifX family molybdenum-iron cluster-binding protein [Deltaproteobacteria bacterium]